MGVIWDQEDLDSEANLEDERALLRRVSDMSCGVSLSSVSDSSSLL